MLEKIKQLLKKAPSTEPVANIRPAELDKSPNASTTLKVFASNLENERIQKLKNEGLYEQEIRKEVTTVAQEKTLTIINAFKDQEKMDRAHILAKDENEAKSIEKEANGRYEHINDDIQRSVESVVDFSHEKGIETKPLDILEDMYAVTEQELEKLKQSYQWTEDLEKLVNNLRESENLARMKEYEESAKPEYREKLVADAVASSPKIANLINSMSPINYDKTEDFQKSIQYALRKERDLKDYKIVAAKKINATYLLNDLRDQIDHLKQSGYPKWLSRQNANRYK
jgi:hypothetical protein